MNELRSEVTAPGELTVYVHGIIGGDVLGPELARILDGIRPEDTSEVVFDIYSPGGSVWEGNLVAAKMREASERGVRTRARVYAAASMATVLAVSTDRVEIAANGRWLVHNPWTIAIGDSAAMEKAARELADTQAEAADLYATVTGATREEMLALMAEERWLMPAEALAIGFVDAIIPGTDPAAYAGPRQAMLATANLPPMVAAMLAEEPADVPPADDHADAGEPVAAECATAPAADGAASQAAGDGHCDQASKTVQIADWDALTLRATAAEARVAELTTENGALAGQLAEATQEIQRKETALQDLQRRLRAFSPATAGTDEDRAATAGVGDPAAYWTHVEKLRAEGMEHEAAILQAAKDRPDDHRAMIRNASRNSNRRP